MVKNNTELRIQLMLIKIIETDRRVLTMIRAMHLAIKSLEIKISVIQYHITF